MLVREGDAQERASECMLAADDAPPPRDGDRDGSIDAACLHLSFKNNYFAEM